MKPDRSSRQRFKAATDRQHVNQYGKPKKKMSRRAAQALGQRTGMNVYRCPTCRAWHVGNTYRED